VLRSQSHVSDRAELYANSAIKIPMSTCEAENRTTIGVKAARGAAALGVRQILVHGMNALTGIVLARLLSPSDFGIFAIITFVLTFLIAFGDVGLGASLIREAAEPHEEDFRSVFTVQQILVWAVVGIAWCLSPVLARAYQLAPSQSILFRLVALSLLFSSLQVIPSVRLERHLEFQKLAAVEIAQALIFNAVTIGMVVCGFGPLSFAVGLLSRSVAGAVMINWVSPWRIHWHWDWNRIKRHMRFGLPYQGIAFTSLLKDSITPIFIGLTLGTFAVGFINWAAMVAVYPVWALMALQRVYLPAFARMRSQKDQLAAFVEKVLLATNAIVAPIAVLTLVLIRPITLLVFGDKWLAAIPLFELLWLANLLVATTTPVMGLLNALGNSKITFAFSAGWMLGTWVLGIPLIHLWGLIGFAIANVIVTLSSMLLIRLAQEQVGFRMLRVIYPEWALALAVGVILFGFQSICPIKSLPTLAGVGIAGLLLFALGMQRLYPNEIGRLSDLFRQPRRVKLLSSVPEIS
jgi:O-antigen/teichoic acid export membrane protein